jgi:hypothetical protein
MKVDYKANEAVEVKAGVNKLRNFMLIPKIVKK